jgi:protoporphyrinogen oxidase
MRIAIVGAGIGGMSAAYDLNKAGHQVTIFDQSAQAGGLMAGFKEPGWRSSVEHYYHHWFSSDRHMLGLINELGLSENVVFHRPVTVMYDRGVFRPFDSIMAAALYPGLGWGINKVRFGLVGLYLRLSQRWQPLEKVTTEAWMRKYTGDFVFDSMWKPMLVGKFTEKYASIVNMAWFWARFHTRTSNLGTYRGGFQAFSDEFARLQVEQGVTLRLNTTIDEIRAADGGLEIQVNGQTEKFERCLVTSSPSQFARLAPGLPEDYLKGLLDLKQLGAVVMVLSLKHQLSPKGYYWYNLPKSAGFPFLALVEHTNFVSPEEFGGNHIVYCGDYLATDHEHFSLDKEELLKRFLPGLARVNPQFSADWVNDSWLHRTTYAQPVPVVNHSRNIPAIQTPIPGLFYASMSQVYPWDRGTNFAVEIARKAAGLMLA